MVEQAKLKLDLVRNPVNHTDYQSMIGSLMYVTSSRPDIMFATYMYARYQANPNEHHVSAINRIFRYLKRTINLGLWYLKDSGFDLTAYSDADHAGCHLDQKIESKYVAVSSCCAQVLWMRTQLTDYGFYYDKLPNYCDSKSEIAISCNPVQHTRTKLIDVRTGIDLPWSLSSHLGKLVKVGDESYSDAFSIIFYYIQYTTTYLPFTNMPTSMNLTAIKGHQCIGDNSNTLCGLMGGSIPLLSLRFSSKGEKLGSTSIRIPIVSCTSFGILFVPGLKPKVLSLTRGGLGKIMRMYLTESDSELSKETSSKILPGGDRSCRKTFKPIASLILRLMSVERASVLHQPDRVRSQRHHVVPIKDLNGVLISLVARFGVISKSTDRIFISHRGIVSHTLKMLYMYKALPCHPMCADDARTSCNTPKMGRSGIRSPGRVTS
uniref:Reverse transcriptase Ty1/copia-type domain-containing protein n=1 Tax=Tanacetum cinerariifolium TaxID=118510 RepID=A0A699HHS3_TANCI|nr:hypothetical protein [Tanacetum cinerariifolium]